MSKLYGRPSRSIQEKEPKAKKKRKRKRAVKGEDIGNMYNAQRLTAGNLLAPLAPAAAAQQKEKGRYEKGFGRRSVGEGITFFGLGSKFRACN